jgi:hypothetical protein
VSPPGRGESHAKLAKGANGGATALHGLAMAPRSSRSRRA